MKGNGQGVLHHSKLTNLLIPFLLLITLFITHVAYAEIKQKSSIQKHHVAIIYSPESMLQNNIAQALSKTLSNTRADITISTISSDDINTTDIKQPDLSIAIGQDGIQYARKNHPKTKKLFIATDPGAFKLEKKSEKKYAVLYMAQSYCRQLHLIKLLNEQWKTVSLLISQNKPIDTKTIEKCASKHDLTIYKVNTSGANNLTGNIKQALINSDVLLALPDKNIYNSKTVKNILLTSYRYRKPVIAFSKNFVRAGALASIHSSAKQIAQSATTIITQYFENNQRFNNVINHPNDFSISTNKQVFRALELPVPDNGRLKQALELRESDILGEPR